MLAGGMWVVGHVEFEFGFTPARYAHWLYTFLARDFIVETEESLVRLNALPSVLVDHLECEF